MQPICYQSLGRDITSYARNDAQESWRLCKPVAERYRPDCYAGVVGVFVDLKATTDRAFAFCRLVEAGRGKARCYEQLGEEIASLKDGAPDRAALCEGVEKGYVDACRFGARLSENRPPELAT